MKKKKNLFEKYKKFLVLAIVIALIVAVIAGIKFARLNHTLPLKEKVVLYIPSGSSFEALTDSLMAKGCIDNRHQFESVAHYCKIDEKTHGGRYVIKPGTKMMTLVRKLRNGSQDPVRVTINKHRTKEQLCEYVASKLEMSADSLMYYLNDSAILAQYNLNKDNVICIFVQNTYEIYWNISPRKFIERMHKEYDHFWTPVRKGQCSSLKLTPEEVIAIASIVEEETIKEDEKAKVASVYLNRVRKGMLLQADPTVRFAIGDFSIRRMLHKHLEIDHPFNTYIYKGIQPGPICIPSISSIDAVLANLKTDYLYFCAKDDFSGYHNFATTLEEHKHNADLFHEALNKRGIK